MKTERANTAPTPANDCQHDGEASAGEQQNEKATDITIRDLFAIVAMAVELSHDRDKELPHIAEAAYMMADSMLEERSKEV